MHNAANSFTHVYVNNVTVFNSVTNTTESSALKFGYTSTGNTRGYYNQSSTGRYLTYYSSYYKLAEQIFNLFKNNNIEVPIEIMLHNIVNSTLSPIKGDIDLCIETVSFYPLQI